jgi:hypothetical protein
MFDVEMRHDLLIKDGGTPAQHRSFMASSGEEVVRSASKNQKNQIDG